MDNGCACCTVRGDLVRSLLNPNPDPNPNPNPNPSANPNPNRNPNPNPNHDLNPNPNPTPTPNQVRSLQGLKKKLEKFDMVMLET